MKSQSWEEKRVLVLRQVLQRKMTSEQAATLLGLTKRQVFRLKKKFQTQGIAALAHRNRDRKPPNAVSLEIREQVVSLAIGDYAKASCVHMAELLAQREGISLSPKTIGRILKAAGIPNPHTHREARRRRSRERKPQEGMLSQCDASPFDWLEGRGQALSLHGCIDDATGKVQGLYFRLHEDATGYLKMLEQVVTNFGVPLSLYSDRHTIFFSPKKDKLSVEEELAGIQVRLTQFGETLSQLKIQHIPARSPQAKGRAERLWGTLQHRLVIEMRLAGISTMEQANAFLPGFIQRFNARFSVTAQKIKTAYQPAPPRKTLDRILCLRYTRIASLCSTLSFQGQPYSLLDSKGKIMLLRPGHKVIILKHLDGSQSALYEGKEYELKLLKRPKPAQEPGKPAKKERKYKRMKPPPNHPWQPKQAFDQRRRLVAEKQKLPSPNTPSTEEAELSEAEWETFKSVSEIFGVDVTIRNKKGQPIPVNRKPIF